MAETTKAKLPTRLVAERYKVSDRTVARWERNPNLNFPKPLIINGRKYRDEAELDAWDRANASRIAATTSAA
jgi:hypothetical protein